MATRGRAEAAKRPRSTTPKSAPALARAERRRRAQEARVAELLEHERALWARGQAAVAGLDEVGAGPLAGPVTAACVVLDPATAALLLGVDDSKRLSAEEREDAAARIKAQARAWAVASATVREIEEVNILQASLLAMRRALAAVAEALGPLDHLLIDARQLSVSVPQTALIKGDSRALSIAAASILAKVDRDAEMTALGLRYPGYGFERHKGYATEEHLAALRKQGVTPVHRRTFEPIRSMLAQPSLFDRGPASW